MHLELLAFMKSMKKKNRDKSRIVQNACVRLRWNSHSDKVYFTDGRVWQHDVPFNFSFEHINFDQTLSVDLLVLLKLTGAVHIHGKGI